MEFVAMFIWLSLCLLIGAMMHSLLHSSFSYKFLLWIAAPGVIIRKFAIAVTAMLTGATVDRANIYHISEREVAFTGEGFATVSKFMVPIAPLFICALVLQGANAALGSPLSLDLEAPEISSFDAGGFHVFIKGLGFLIVSLVRNVFQAEWGNFRLYVLFLLLFSLSLGAGVPLDKVRNSLIGIIILVLVLTLLCTLFKVPSGPVNPFGPPRKSAFAIKRLRDFLMETSAMALIMMLCGMLTSVMTGIGVRIFEIIKENTGALETPPPEAEAEHEKE
ncbi:MAG: hypothetical protein ACLFWL_08015 [Candidatus Brocadiia bacterium]